MPATGMPTAKGRTGTPLTAPVVAAVRLRLIVMLPAPTAVM